MKALLVIDMQKASFSQSKRYDSACVIDRINKLSDAFRKSGNKVIFIQHNGEESNGHKKHSKGWEILDELERAKGDLIVQKTNCDSFYKTKLETMLRSLGIEELFITGCATDYCVDTTIRSALSKDFSVTVPQNCHTTADRPHLKAEQVIEHHEWIWRGLITPNSKITILAFEKALYTNVLS